MADFSALKTSIQNYIKQNGNEEITGNLLQQVLLSMVTTLGDSAINDLVTALNNEVSARQNADGTLQGNINTLQGNINTLQGVVNGIKANIDNGYVYAGIANPSTTPASGKVFYLALTAGTYTNFGATVVPQGINILKYNGSAWSLDSFLGLDNAPTQGSNNLVKSGGVLDSIIKDGSAFDLSAYNNGTTYADLSAALTALNALPAAYKKGGMSMKYVQTSDNKYVQARCMAQNFTTDVTQWQGVDDEPVVGSKNLVESGGIAKANYKTTLYAGQLIFPIIADTSSISGGQIQKNAIKIPAPIPSGYYTFSFDCSNASVSKIVLYAKHQGDVDAVLINEDILKGEEYELNLGNNIEYLTFYVAQAVVVEGDTFDFKLIKTGSKIDTMDKEIQKNKVFVRENNEGIKLPINALYASSSDNVLDTNYVIKNIAPAYFSGDNHVCYGKENIMSGYIPLLGASKITVSGYDNTKHLGVLFLRNEFFEYNESLFFSLVSGSSRTINVPNNVKYCVVALQVEGFSNDYSSMKVSLTDTAATEQYSPLYIGTTEYPYFSEILRETDLDTCIISDNLLDTNVGFSGKRITDDSPYFVSTDNTDVILSKAIPVAEKDYVFTWKSTANVGGNTRWIAFCSDKEMIAANVISIVKPTFVTNSQSVQIITINIPAGTKYIYLSLRVSGDSTQNYKNDTVAMGVFSTSAQYEEGIESLKDKKLAASNIPQVDWLGNMQSYEVEKKYLPYSVGSLSNELSVGHQHQRANLLMFTDNHIDTASVSEYCLQNVIDAIDFANNSSIEFDAILNAGDFFTVGGIKTKAQSKAIAAPFFGVLQRSKYPVIFSKGNHDLNDWDNRPSNTFNDDDWGQMWLNYAESKYGIVRQTKSSGKKSTWHYYDITSKKIRVICLDAQDTDKTTTNGSGNVLCSGAKCWYISNEQMTWLGNVLSNFTEEGWGVVVVLHQTKNEYGTWYATASGVYPQLESSIQKAMDMLVAFNNHTVYQTSQYSFGDNSFFNLDALNIDFSYSSMTEKPHLICVLDGHVHYDRNFNYNGINIITTINGSCTSNYSDDRVVRVPQTTTQNAFDILSIDTIERKIRIVRYGAGKNCYGVGGDRFLPDGLSF